MLKTSQTNTCIQGNSIPQFNGPDSLRENSTYRVEIWGGDLDYWTNHEEVHIEEGYQSQNY